MSDEYCLADTSDERARLRLLQDEFDGITTRRLARCNLQPGQNCMEIGPGEGSIARWMAEAVGESGKVVVVDRCPANFDEGNYKNIELYENDVSEKGFLNQLQQSFDLIHTRFVMVHIQDNAPLIKKLVSLLKPGGWLVLEEPDFSTLAPMGSKDDADYKTISALQKVVMQRGCSKFFAPHMPQLLHSNGLANIHVESLVPVSRGGSSMSQMHARTVAHLKEDILATGIVTNADIEAFFKCCNDDSHWIRECQVIGVLGQKPVSA